MFKIGKFYKHNSGIKYYILGYMDTYFNSISLIGEDPLGNLHAIIQGNTDGFVEITEEEFINDNRGYYKFDSPVQLKGDVKYNDKRKFTFKRIKRRSFRKYK